MKKTTKLRATITFEYEAYPDWYSDGGENREVTPERMAEIDAHNFKNDPKTIREEMGEDFTVKVEVVG